MNVFEDLIEELKEENLLEQTVKDVQPSEAEFSLSTHKTHQSFHPVEPVLSLPSSHHQTDELRAFDAHFAASNGNSNVVDDSEVYRKRAVDEVSCLQMVEHMLTAIEREHMKIVPAIFDDLKVKKALHDYLKLLDVPMSSETLDAEGRLLLETEEWYTALSARDREISVANVRRFCENSRPVLSTQALLSLARFYRVSPFSEPVRSKFDFVMTRLFARDAGTEKRRSLFEESETAGHIRDLYDGWSSVAMFGTEDSGEKVSGAVEGFKALITEAEKSESFDALIRGNFFNRIRLFKERTGELFFVPEVVATAIDCNVRIGNRFVDLLVVDKARLGTETIEEKYAYDHDTVISGAASKTLGVSKLLKNNSGPEVQSHESKMVRPIYDTKPDMPSAAKKPREREWDSATLFGINKWLALASAILIALSVGFYLWAENSSSGESSVKNAATVDLQASGLTDQLTTARSSGETMYAIVQPSWDGLSTEQQNEFLNRAAVFANTKGLRKVNLMNYKGRTIAFADAQRSELIRP